MIVFSAMLGIVLAGCGTLREQQNPQPKMQAPCEEWLDLKQQPAKQNNAGTIKKDEKKKSLTKDKKGIKKKKGIKTKSIKKDKAA